jgi:hypothetical protein
MKMILFLLIGTALGFSTSAERNQASDELFCADMFQACEFGWHVLQGPGGNYRGSEAHGDCRMCVDEGTCHSPCINFSGDEEELAAYNAALDALRRGDIGAALAVADRAAGYVRVNTVRSTVQILSCDRSRVIANANITD